MIILYLLLWVGACVCFAVVAFHRNPAPRPNLVALGLLLAAAVFAIQTLVRVA